MTLLNRLLVAAASCTVGLAALYASNAYAGAVSCYYYSNGWGGYVSGDCNNGTTHVVGQGYGTRDANASGLLVNLISTESIPWDEAPHANITGFDEYWQQIIECNAHDGAADGYSVTAYPVSACSAGVFTRLWLHSEYNLMAQPGESQQVTTSESNH